MAKIDETRRALLAAATRAALLAAPALGAPAARLLAETQAGPGPAATQGDDMTRIRFVVGATTLSATLDATEVARDFAALLPLELELRDYHGIEKIADLPRRLNTDAAPESHAPERGDITVYAPWGNLAIFYKPFARSRGLVRLGAFDDDLDPLLSAGDGRVRIERVD